MNHVHQKLGLLLILGLFLISGGGRQEPPHQIGSPLDDPLPEFAARRADAPSETFSSKDLEGKPGVVIFWRPAQSFSLEALRNIASIVSELGADRLHVVAVDTSSSTSDTVTSALGAVSFPHTALLDPQRDLYRAFGVIVSPTTLLFDREGVIRYKIASHPRQYRQIVQTRLRFLLEEIDEERMNRQVTPVMEEIDEDLAAAWRMYHLGNRLKDEGHLSEAVAEYERAVTKYPSLPEARCALGYIALSSGDYDLAREHFQLALNYQPASSTARLGQAAVLARTGAERQAEQLLLGLLDHQAVATRVRYELGRIYRGRGESHKAAALFEDALATMYPEVDAEVAFDESILATSPSEKPTASTSGASATPVGASPTAATIAAPAIEAVKIPSDATFVGVQKCKKCHFKQWKSWSETPMAGAFDLLKPDVEPARKERHGFDPGRDYTADASCVTCHATGFKHTGGFTLDGARNDVQGVTCESCHGPGDSYIAIHEEIQDEQRNYQQSELFKAGQFDAGASVCVSCHVDAAPCIERGMTFDYETRKDQGTHWHGDLRLRSN